MKLKVTKDDTISRFNNWSWGQKAFKQRIKGFLYV